VSAIENGFDKDLPSIACANLRIEYNYLIYMGFTGF